MNTSSNKNKKDTDKVTDYWWDRKNNQLGWLSILLIVCVVCLIVFGIMTAVFLLLYYRSEAHKSANNPKPGSQQPTPPQPHNNPKPGSQQPTPPQPHNNPKAQSFIKKSKFDKRFKGQMLNQVINK